MEYDLNSAGSDKSVIHNMKQDSKAVANGDVNTHNVTKSARRYVRSATERKLVLHFDVRNTILVADSVTNIQVEQALNSYLTGVVWGTEQDDKWVWYSDKPSLTAPFPKAITYYKHLEKKLVKVPSDRATLRQATGDFTQVDRGKRFLPYFSEGLKNLEWTGGFDPEERLTMIGKDGKQYHYILPSFFKLIDHLYELKRDFSIIIRTYGWDAANVLSSTQHSLAGHHPMFLKPAKIDINPHPGKVTRIPGQIRFERFHFNESMKKVIETTDRNIYKSLTDSKGVSAYVDDFLHWQDNDYHHTAAKPMWIDPQDGNVHHIFFDDNIRTTDSECIVDLRIFDQPDLTTARSLSLDEIKLFENMCLVQADLLESTSNVNYFVEKVALCESKYSQYLDSCG